ncbi:MAG: HD domain-containing protein [Candidatus Fimadaptatus sp.]
MNDILTARAAEAMIERYCDGVHDVNHFLKVHSYARMIGILEGLDEDVLLTLELAAIVHDIACPLCRRLYGRADGDKQEQEGPALARELLSGLGCDAPRTERVCALVGRHHTYTNVDGPDARILLEADFLVNADEGHASEAAMREMLTNVFRTGAGTRLLRRIYGLEG